MSPPNDVECSIAAAASIVDDALLAAIDEAIESSVLGEYLAAAVLHHICSVLYDLFKQSPDDIALLARKSAAAYVARTAEPSKHH